VLRHSALTTATSHNEQPNKKCTKNQATSLTLALRHGMRKPSCKCDHANVLNRSMFLHKQLRASGYRACTRGSSPGTRQPQGLLQTTCGNDDGGMRKDSPYVCKCLACPAICCESICRTCRSVKHSQPKHPAVSSIRSLHHLSPLSFAN
jgi:hypothetical protein